MTKDSVTNHRAFLSCRLPVLGKCQDLRLTLIDVCCAARVGAIEIFHNLRTHTPLLMTTGRQQTAGREDGHPEPPEQQDTNETSSCTHICPFGQNTQYTFGIN